MSNIVNISIDDVSPHPLSSVKVLDQCHDLIKIFPEIKFSIFVPISYWRTVKPHIATPAPLQIDKFPGFCDYLRNLSSKNFEICYHGYHHGIPGKSDNDELKDVTYDQALQVIAAMRNVVKSAGLEDYFKPIIRPPAWRMSADAIRAFRDSGFKILALCREDYAVESYGGEESKLDDVVYATSYPPIRGLGLTPKTEIVYHACEWDKNYLSGSQAQLLAQFLNENIDAVEFGFLGKLL
jgi:predicted deacetylase